MLESSGGDRPEDRWISIAAAATLTGKDRTTIFRARKSGRLRVWTNEQRIEAIRLSDLARLYPMAGWSEQDPEAIRRHALSGRFDPVDPGDAEILAWRGARVGTRECISEQDPELAAAAVRQAAERLAIEQAAGWRLLAWAGAVSMLLVAIANFFGVAALARLAGLF